MLLLLLAESPLIVILICAVLQNDELKARDALSRVSSAQVAALTLLTADLNAVATLAKAGAQLPPALLHDHAACTDILTTLAAADAGHVAGIAVTDAQGSQVCATPHFPAGSLSAHGQTPIFATADGALLVSRPMPSGGVITAYLAARSTPVPAPRLWLRQNAGWAPASPSAAGVLPPPPADFGQLPLKPLRIARPDGSRSLYSAVALPPGVATPGAILAAGSDIRDASSQSTRTFVLRVAELAAFFVAELLLIAGGVSLVAARPLRRLNTAVDRWRADGTFSFPNNRSFSLEVTELAGSFAQATASLNQREQELRSAIAQQEVLMQEIHHRVKNNLQIIASLLNLQAARIKAPEARAEFQSARDRVRALATLHRYLYAHGELHMVDMRAFFAELCGQLFQAFNEAEGARIALDIIAPDLNISSDQAVPIALIVTETVGNALKYAFPANRRGRIQVEFVVDAANMGRLTIRDDGVGLDQRGEPQHTEGLGLQLVRGFAKQIGAQLTISTDHGTCYQLDMPIQRQRQDIIAFGARPAA